jgi:hypothetical protein
MSKVSVVSVYSKDRLMMYFGLHSFFIVKVDKKYL